MSDRPDNEGDLAHGRLALLNSQADAVRAELSRLRRDLAMLHAEESSDHTAGLRAVNEKLLVAALDASAVADSAKKSLAGLIVATQRDVLTNTPNRALTLERLENAVGMAKRHSALMAVLFVDLDHLKSINDSLGHAAGDAALQLAARRLESVVRSTDTVSRHGGDEFIVVLNEVAKPGDAGDIATKMLEVLSVPTQVGRHVLSLTASIGISVFPLDASNGLQLIEAADEAMYVVKRRGGGGFGYHDPAQMLGKTATWGMTIRSHAESAESVGMANMRQVNEELVSATIAAHELKDLAEEAHGKQIKFMAMVAHELRNPLTPIQLAASMLSLEGVDESKLNKLQAIIEDEVKQMVRLVEDLLDGTRIRTGKLRLELSDVDVTSVLRSTSEGIMPRIVERSQQIDVDVPLDPILVRGDRIRLTQVFSNLLDNASKYTPAGGHIEVTLGVVGDQVAVAISDSGVGIPAHAMPHIFDLFVQEVGALMLHGGGLGVGLAVVHELVAAHLGTVTVQSEGRNLGSRFTVSLPLARRD